MRSPILIWAADAVSTRGVLYGADVAGEAEKKTEEVRGSRALDGEDAVIFSDDEFSVENSSRLNTPTWCGSSST
jgi:hypothetical protein